MNRIKICGLTRECDIEAVNEYLPDYIGFILSLGFRRSIDFGRAKQLSKAADSKITKVGVFVNENGEYIKRFIGNGIIDAVQLHGNEPPDLINELRETGIPVIKMLKCPKETYAETERYSGADYFLFDSGTGSGKAFDWSLLPKCKKPFFLAGGIGINNVEKAKAEISPFCFDVSSSVETNGFKDKNKIKQIIERVRNE